ncbi:TIGR03546 family protein [candidate division KSB1 bacterium]|nr:TIGR03546 family protein [candidate division KSB1 bacterium]
MLWLKIVSKIIKAFRSGESPNKIAAGFGIGFLIGLMPFWTLQGVILLILLILLDVNLSAGTLAIIVFGLFSYLLDPLFDVVGTFVLTGIPFLYGLWESLYNMPVAPLSRFNNTVAMGSFVCGLILFAPVFYGMKKLVLAYRSGLEERINKLKIVKAVKGSSIYKWYVRIRDFGGE